MKRSSVPLSSLQAADEATIVDIAGPESVHLAGFGLYPGMLVTVRQTFPSFVVKTEETEVALESGVADKIQVLPTHGSSRPPRRRRLHGRGKVGSGSVPLRSEDRSNPVGTTTDPGSDPPASDSAGTPSQGFPRKVFGIAVILVCAALTISALHTFFTLRSLRTEYLDNRGHDIAALVDSRLRGPGRRFDLENRQRVLDTTLEEYAQGITFLALLDGSGNVTAQAGTPGPSSDVFLFEVPLGGPRGPRGSAGQGGPGRGGPGQGGPGRRLNQSSMPGDTLTLQIGLETDQAAFINSQAWVHLGISLAAVVLLGGLAVYFLRTLDQYLALQAHEASERQLAQLGRLSATLAHEIRNPLGAMKGLTQLVQEDLPQDHRAHELTATVVSEAERLEKLVTDLLAFARPRALSLQPVSVGELVSNVADLLQTRAKERGVGIRVNRPSEPIHVRADPDGLRQVLLNVIGNALDASKDSDEIEVTPAKRGSMIEISVLDRGTGLGSADPEDLFQPFRTTKTQGSGLGLAVSRQIVERLGGRISLENRLGGGAVCRIRLPRVTPDSGDD